MSTFLELSQKLRQNIRASGTGPVSVLGQSGELNRIIDFTADAWSDIQNRHINWRWLRSTFTFNTTAGIDTYAYNSVTDSRLSATINRFSRWIALDDQGCSNITMFPTSTGVAGERYLQYLPWASYRYIYKRGVQTTIQGVPVHFTISPQNQLMIGPNPNGIYTCRGEYQMSAQILAVDADIPEMPIQFHDLIMYRAMEKMAIDLAAPELINRAKVEGGRIMRSLEVDQLPPVGMAGPLV